MKERHIIAAVADGGGIGYNGELLWRIPADLQRFKDLTLGNVVIMGRKTFESIGSKPLKCRNNIVVSTNGIAIPDSETNNLFNASSLEEAYKLAEQLDGDKIFVIGGGQLYADALPYTDVLDITEIFAIPHNADTFFPSDLSDFIVTHRSERYWSVGKPNFRFVTYKNKKVLNRRF
jgi:dihydrofolate reductase